MGDFMDRKEIDARTKAERDAGFDRAKAEKDLHEVMFALGIGSEIGDSVVPGVAVYYCEDMADEARIQRMLEKRGHKIAEVRSTKWINSEGLDEDAIAVAFDVACLPADWRDDEEPAPRRR